MNGSKNGVGAAVVAVPVLVDKAMQRAWADWTAATRLPHRTHPQNVVRCERLAGVEDRRVRWWGVLERWAYSSQSTVPLVFGAAVVSAKKAAESDRRFWTETAQYYRLRVAGIDPDVHGEFGGRGWSA